MKEHCAVLKILRFCRGGGLLPLTVVNFICAGIMQTFDAEPQWRLLKEIFIQVLLFVIFAILYSLCCMY